MEGINRREFLNRLIFIHWERLAVHLNATTIKFSNIYFTFVLLLHLVAIACVFAIGLNYFFKLILCGALIVLLFRSPVQPKNLYTAVGKDICDRWFVVDYDNEKIFVELLQGSMVTRRFVLLRVCGFDGIIRYIPLFSDSIHPDDFRKLRVILT